MNKNVEAVKLSNMHIHRGAMNAYLQGISNDFLG